MDEEADPAAEHNASEALFRLRSEHTAFHQLAKSRMICPCCSASGGKLLRGVEAETDNRNGSLLEHWQKAGTEGDGIFHRVLGILPSLPEIIEHGISHDNGGIDPNPVRSEGNDFFCRADTPFRGVTRKAGHHLKNQTKAGCFDQPGGILHIGTCVAPAGEGKHLIAHGLGAQLHRLHAKTVKP